jgi:hypothetical protein
MMTDKDLLRFVSKIALGDSCWPWLARKAGGGYGYFSLSGKEKRAHRVAYEEFVGAIPPGLDLDHLCRNRICVRPDHLEPVSRSENNRRGLSGANLVEMYRSRTHCPQGHAYDEANTACSKGERRCVTCRRDQDRRRYWARKTA